MNFKRFKNKLAGWADWKKLDAILKNSRLNCITKLAKWLQSNYICETEVS